MPGQAGYEEAKLLYNTRFDALRPPAVVYAAKVEDIQATLRFARANGLHVIPRSGGHSYAGWSSGAGIVIQAPFRQITFGAGSVTVGASASLIDVYDAVASAGASIGAGSCPTVGVAGLALGGGIGVLTRAFGLTCDQLVGIDVVTADGAQRHCSDAEESDLFWAARGGGGGNFAVATSFTFATRPATALAIAYFTWPWANAVDVLGAWQVWMKDVPASLWSTLHLEGGAGAPGVAVHAVQIGSAAGLSAWLDKLVALVGAAPDYKETGIRGYRDVMLVEAGCFGRTLSACHLRGISPAGTPGGELARETFAARSIVADAPLTRSAIDAIVGSVEGASGRSGVGGVAVLFDALGGAVADIAPAATAFPHRSAFAVVQLYGSWSQNANSDATLAWLREAHARARPLIGPGAYVNYIDPDLPDWPTAYYGANYARLRDVKRRYDPDRVFDFPQAIG